MCAGIAFLVAAQGVDKVVGIPLLALGGYFYAGRNKWNKTEHAKLMAEWERSWKCLTCGAAFVPGGGEPALLRETQPQQEGLGLGRIRRLLK